MNKVVTVGTFDILHPAHKELLMEAKGLGDYLLVVVVPDEIVYKNKGERPANKQESRLNNLKRLPWVDEVSIDCLCWGYQSIISYKPDIFVFGPDQRTSIETRTIDLLDSAGINPRYLYSNSQKIYSSTELKRKYHQSSINCD